LNRTHGKANPSLKTAERRRPGINLIEPVFMKQYHELAKRILEEGETRDDRTGVGTIGIFGHMMRFDLSHGFPLVTTKKVFLKGVIAELLWFLTGETNIRPLLEQGVSIWTDWPLARYRKETGEDIGQKEFERRIVEDEGFAARWGDLGPVYGKQWRRWTAPDGREIDQISGLVEALKSDPYSRRHIVSAWNVADLPEMALAPCHALINLSVRADNRLSLLIYQRSCDLFLGVPFNIASYALLTHMLAQQAGLAPGELVWTGGDVHIYRNHVDQVRLQLTRNPRPLPRLEIRRKPDTIFGYRLEDFEAVGYDPHPAIKGEVAV
jgi:thymidylate synthase